MTRKTTIPKGKIFRTKSGWKVRGQLGFSPSEAKAESRYRALKRKVKGAKGFKLIGRTLARTYKDVGGLIGIQSNVISGQVMSKTQASISKQLAEEEYKRERTLIGIQRKKAGLPPARKKKDRLPKVTISNGVKIEGVRKRFKTIEEAEQHFTPFRVGKKLVKPKEIEKRYVRAQLGGRIREIERSIFGTLPYAQRREQRRFLRILEQREERLKLRGR